MLSEGESEAKGIKGFCERRGVGSQRGLNLTRVDAGFWCGKVISPNDFTKL